MKIEGPFSIKDVDGLKTPAYIFKLGGQRETIGEVTVKVSGEEGMTFDVNLNEKYKDNETASFEVPMRYVYLNLPDVPKINWRQNCLTAGPHDGRPEAIWNLPLMQTTFMFTPIQLQALVVDRIYNDAMQYVKSSPFTQQGTEASVRFTPEWADEIKELAGPRVLPVYQQKVGELSKYYLSSPFKKDMDGVVERNKLNKLNPRFAPLHGHDTINMLCRIVGVGCSRDATPSVGE